MNHTRSLSRQDINDLAAHLVATNAPLLVGLSELGFDPRGYTRRELGQWLSEETGIRQVKGKWIGDLYD